MLNLDLTGDWTVFSRDSSEAVPATVPGCVHLDLLAAGRIPDPFFGDNEKQVQWISEREWIYSRDFHVTPDLLAHGQVLLQCDGLDTLAHIELNGVSVARTDNMFRSWEFDVKPLLREGINRIEIRFEAALLHTRALQKQRYIHAWLARDEGANYLRKEQCSFGWDWGPKLVTCGIWRPIRLVAWSTARINDVQITQRHGKRLVEVTVRVRLQQPRGQNRRRVSKELSLRASLHFEGREVTAETLSCAAGEEVLFRFPVRNPHLWFPRGLGEQPLYALHVELQNPTGEKLDSWSRRIGLRTLRLERFPDKWGERFQFTANGIPFFAKGANWIPADAFAPRVSADQYRDLLESAAEAHMNMIRVWGGGIYEPEIFYDLCDELGLCVWQDFMFACACYPTFDKAFLENVRLEAEEIVRRLRHHASIALWCGNNELEQGLCGPEWTLHQMPWTEYAKIFDRMLPEVISGNDPERDYWPGSPHTPGDDRKNCNSPESGDAHLWSVWHRREPFEWYRTSFHRFCSEFGFQSFPEPKTIDSFATPADQNISSYIMDFHQRSWVGNGLIMSYLLSWYQMPKGFRSFTWTSQILQGMAIKYAVEHWRRQMPRSMGALYWQLNDTWPGPSWSSIDYFGRWKALHWMACRFFAPVLVSLVEKNTEREVEVWMTSDLLKDAEGELILTVTDCAGKELHRQRELIRIRKQKSALATRLDVSALAADEEWGKPAWPPLLTEGGALVDAPAGPRDLMVWAEVKVDGEAVSRNLATFVRPKHLKLRDPAIRAKISRAVGSSYEVTLTARRPALSVWIELEGIDARMSDNFIDLPAGQAITIKITPATRIDKKTITAALRVRSLVDTF